MSSTNQLPYMSRLKKNVLQHSATQKLEHALEQYWAQISEKKIASSRVIDISTTIDESF